MSATPSRRPRVLLVGAGGIGAPAAIALAAAGLERLEVADDDIVERTNLHRQILFSEEDVGRSKLDAFRGALRRRAPRMEIGLHATRFLPDTATTLCAASAGGPFVVLDATDNFATRFLIADAARLAGVAVVHAAAVRWQATVMAAGPAGRPCYRCLFEDLPSGDVPDCATAGVVGPVCGVAGALAADLCLRILEGDPTAYGAITTFDGKTDVLRRIPLRPRADCALCGASPTVREISEARYAPPSCAVS